MKKLHEFKHTKAFDTIYYFIHGTYPIKTTFVPSFSPDRKIWDWIAKIEGYIYDKYGLAGYLVDRYMPNLDYPQRFIMKKNE